MSTDYDDHEPDHDDHDRFTGPSREEPEDEPPLSLEEIQAAYDDCGGTIWELGPSARIVAAGVLELIAEVRQARAAAERMAAAARREFAVTDGPPPADDAELVTGEQADLVLKNNRAAAVWERYVYPSPWDQLSAEPPF